MPQRQIKLYFSHSVEHLAARLNEQLTLQRQHTDNILKPVEVIVPNGNMQKYLQLNMATQDGICANVTFPFLETGLFQAMLKLPAVTDQVQMLNHGQLALKIWQKFADISHLDVDVYQPIKHYFSDQEAAPLQSKKHWQLSQRLALLLLDYELKRPEMVQAWFQGDLVFRRSQDERLQALERMQKDLYLSLLDKGNDTRPKALTLFQLWQQQDWSQVTSKNQANSLHIFTPTRLSEFHRQLLCDLARCYDIHIYQLNVCAEYWQDMRTEGEDIWHRRLMQQKLNVTDADGNVLDADELNNESFIEMDDSAIENPLLKAWGKPGREALKLYSELEEDAIHFDVSFSDEWLESEQLRNAGLLHSIQDAILFRDQGAGEITNANELASLQITQAPSIYREVEAVYNNVLWNLQQDSSLEPSEIAVLVTDMDKYRFVIEQVFGELNRQHGAHLNYALVDASVTVESVYARGVLALFDLLAHDFIRAEVFDWLRNPCVMEALQLSNDDWEAWLQTISQLGVFAGFDHLYAAGELETKDDQLSQRFTWAQGLQRLHVYLANEANDHSMLDADGIGQLSVLLDYLQQQHLLLNQERSAAAWETVLIRMFDTLLAVPEDLPKEQTVQLALSQSLLKLANQVPEMKLNFHDVRHFIEAELNDLSASKGHYLTGGVVCAALQPMRPIPFRVTYILGLDAPSFPGGLRFDTLDLSNRSRRIGDINQIENKQYLFLETLMCSREKLYLSYVGEDLSKAESIDRSPVLDDLADFAMSFIDQKSLPYSAFPETKLPLDSRDSAGFRFEASDFSDISINYSLTDYYLAWSGMSPELAQTQANDMLSTGSNNQKNAAAQFLKLFDHADDESHTETDNLAAKAQISSASVVDARKGDANINVDINVDIKDLAKYLENAMSEVLSRFGMVNKHPDQEALVTHEPFELNGLDKHKLYQKAVWDVIESKGNSSLSDCIKTSCRQMATQSTLPVEFFVDIDALSQVEQEGSYSNMMESLGTLSPCKGPVVFGDAVTDKTPLQSLPSIEIPMADGSKVRLHGVVDGLFISEGHAINGPIYQAQLVVSGGQSKAKTSSSLWDKKLIKPFLNWCLMQMSSDVNTTEQMDLHLFYSDYCHQKTLRYWATDEVAFSGPAHIRRYLSEVLQDYLTMDDRFLNCEQVNQAKTRRDDELNTVIPYLKPTSKAGSVHAFNYAVEDIDEYAQAEIQAGYLQKAVFKDYEEISKIVEIPTSDHVLLMMHKRYWPLHAMMLAQLPDDVASASDEKEVS